VTSSISKSVVVVLLFVAGCAPLNMLPPVTGDGGMDGLVDAGEVAPPDAGLVDDLRLAADWTAQRGAPLVATTVPLTVEVPNPHGGLYHLTENVSVLATGRCGSIGGACELRWLSPTGLTTHTEAQAMIGESRLDFEEVLALARRATTHPCFNGPLQLGTAALLHLDTGALVHEFANDSSGALLQRDQGTLFAQTYTVPTMAGACPTPAEQRRWSLIAPFAPVLTDDDALAASPVRFVVTTALVQNPRRMLVLERDRDAPTNDRLLLSVEEPDEDSNLRIIAKEDRTIVASLEPGSPQALARVFTIDRATGTSSHFTAPSRLQFPRGGSLRWFWFCEQPLGATTERCVVHDGRGERAVQTLVSRGHVWLRADLYVLYSADLGEAEVVELTTGERTPLNFQLDDGHLRLIDAAGVHDFGENATLSPLLEFPAWGQQLTRLIIRTTGGTKSLEAWHAPSGRHVRLTSRLFTNPSTTLCTAGLVTGVGLTHPGLYSFVEPSLAGDGTGELFVGAADLLTPPRSLGSVDLGQCRKPRASIDGLTIGVVERDGTNGMVKLRRASLR
jgi:hypothetical protein